MLVIHESISEPEHVILIILLFACAENTDKSRGPCIPWESGLKPMPAYMVPWDGTMPIKMLCTLGYYLQFVCRCRW
jgi:hypothetical protein